MKRSTRQNFIAFLTISMPAASSLMAWTMEQVTWQAAIGMAIFNCMGAAYAYLQDSPKQQNKVAPLPPAEAP